MNYKYEEVDNFYKRLGNIIRVQRIKLELNQNFVASKANISQRYLSKIEYGLVKPEFKKVCKIAEVLNLPLDSLIAPEEKDDTSDFLIIKIASVLCKLAFEERVILLKILNFYLENKELILRILKKK